ncbi:hypothetical protein LEP1GSC132_2940 [Leptospira kirschneri str. 200803703]|uniref:Uncharacterized protein n=1 Tax=Leptospira kirschneri str. 200802841 TaxID=1193047 RepID=A0A828Y7E2_9LEPT|nr:hypothetical protein LEP1GSC131_0221 [Leptospira kirschneri str. 200802841]EKQ84294.1 hypothetical protein LEP1GSC064_3334 [Leptospira kirschneri serovar Grippotyphosa str. Moskva]EKR06606.1 hypothetical protein LEP1GSC122_1230 [Leptospira kirschneri serovar Valbuzzi str. 200702274]EMK02118.1 hypothetical protein LEP1GSC176_0231 [Leptospira kirschneri str. MMD1493]EMK18941.1 hypothetical protein LEP1GSC042_1404 [Leptospira kirschneri serovar Bim str. PUO 1247]EMN05709.1 hypothetical protein
MLKYKFVRVSTDSVALRIFKHSFFVIRVWEFHIYFLTIYTSIL